MLMLIINNNSKGKTTNIKGRKISGRKWLITATLLDLIFKNYYKIKIMRFL